MAKYKTFLYSSSVLYGATIHMSSIYPDSGPSIGGNDFIITGSGFNPLIWDDEFTGVVLDVAKWVDISSGSGSIATGSSHLQLSTGVTGGSVAGVETVNTFTNFQFEVRTLIPNITNYPDTTVVLLDYRMYVDANNYASIRLDLDSDGDMTLYCETYVGGTRMNNYYSSSWTRGLSVFKILRYGDSVYFIVNGSVVHKNVGVSTSLATIRMFSYNDAATYDVYNIIVEQFKYRSFVVFDDQPVHNTITVSDYRVRGLVCPSMDNKDRSAAHAGLVDVVIIGINKWTENDAYEYYFEDSLRVINSEQSDVKLSFINDDQIKTKTGVKKGIGL